MSNMPVVEASVCKEKRMIRLIARYLRKEVARVYSHFTTIIPSYIQKRELKHVWKEGKKIESARLVKVNESGRLKF